MLNNLGPTLDVLVVYIMVRVHQEYIVLRSAYKYRSPGDFIRLIDTKSKGLYGKLYMVVNTLIAVYIAIIIILQYKFSYEKDMFIDTSIFYLLADGNV